MLGISGIISDSPGERLEALIRTMAQCMAQQGDYSPEVMIDEQSGFGVGWMRRGCASKESSPVWHRNQRAFLLVYGEHFPDRTESSSIYGNDSEGESNLAARLLQIYNGTGPRFLASLNGWFCGVLLDLRQRKIILFNDRYGLGRIYFHENRDGFFFASQAKSLLKVVPALRRLDAKGMAEWFSCGCALQNRTLFRGMSLLPAGSAWIFGTGSVSKKSYFSPELWEGQPKLDEESYYRGLRERFPRVLARYFQGNQRVGMSLTGGLDGRMIMAWTGKMPDELPCYTFSGAQRESRDVQIARQVAKTCRQPHQTIAVDDRFVSDFPDLAEKAVYFTDGAMDVTGAVELYVNRMAREVAPVRLTGNYGSETLRRNIAFRPAILSTKCFDSDLCAQANDAAIIYAEERRGNRLSFIAFKQVPWHHFARFAVEQSQLIVRSPFLDNDLVSLAFQAPAGMETSAELYWRLILDRNPKLATIPTDRGIAYPANRLANRLRYWVENVLAKSEYAYDYGMPQWLARLDHTLASLKPERLFLGRQKFCHFRVLYRDRLASYVKEILLDPRSLSRPYLKRRQVEQMVTGHVRGNCNYTTEIHKLLSMELVHRSLLEQR